MLQLTSCEIYIGAGWNSVTTIIDVAFVVMQRFALPHVHEPVLHILI